MLMINKNKWSELFSKISSNRELYMPIEKGGQVQFERWSAGAKVRFDKLNTVKSARIFLSQ